MKLRKFLERGWGVTKLRVKLLITVLLVVSAALLAVSLTALGALRNQMVDNLDTQMVDTINSLSARQSQGVNVVDPGQGEPLALPGSFVIVSVAKDGSILGSIRSVNALSALPDPKTFSDMRLSDLDVLRTVDSNGGAWRAVITESGDSYLILAVSLEGIEETANQLLRIDLIVSLTALLIITLASSFLLTRNLEPLHALEETARRISAGDLSERVPPSDPSTEVGSLAQALNSMLERLEVAFAEKTQAVEVSQTSEAQMRQFIADVSHELRTPLTSIRGFAELGARDKSEVLERITHEAERMSSLVDDLLMLAKLDRAAPLEKEEVDLVALTYDALDPLVALNPQRSIDVEFSSSVMASVDPGAFRQVVTNLVANALYYTSGSVHVELENLPGAAALTISDEGPGMTEEVRSRVFERFYRADSSRSRNTGGSGLGLAIVSSLVQAHGGTVSLESSPSSGSVFRVVLNH